MSIYTSTNVPVAIFFFFYTSRHHRVLHSFPTRRSSDLPGLRRSRRPPRGQIRQEDRPQAGALRAGPREGPAEDDLDRKSTRLNSSHTVISYAVFCLKKKNKDKQVSNSNIPI